MMSATTSRLDPARIRRALSLEVERLGSGSWLIGGRLVDPDEGCSCPDRIYRGATCKHELRARLDVLDPELLTALRTLIDSEVTT